MKTIKPIQTLFANGCRKSSLSTSMLLDVKKKKKVLENRNNNQSIDRNQIVRF